MFKSSVKLFKLVTGWSHSVANLYRESKDCQSRMSRLMGISYRQLGGPPTCVAVLREVSFW